MEKAAAVVQAKEANSVTYAELTGTSLAMQLFLALGTAANTLGINTDSIEKVNELKGTDES